jgi:hypothetical protein
MVGAGESAIPMISICGDVNVRRAHPSGYDREPRLYGCVNACADACEDGCDWNGHVSVCEYACADARASLS